MEYQYINVKKTDLGGVNVHCVQAPLEGEMVNAQIIETSNKLLLIDTLQLVPHAEELKRYVESLQKPLDRILITHYHPDHWFGAASFKEYPMYAFKGVIDMINAMADFVLGYHRSLHPDDPEVIPSEKVYPTQEIEEGPMTLDGVNLHLYKILETECPINMAIELPDHNALLPQDLIYNKAYPYFGERTSSGELSTDNWIRVLETFQQKNYKYIFPGHGDPTDPSIIKEMIGYLRFVKQKVEEGLQGEELINSIKQKYPDYKLELTLIMSNYMLFEFKPQ